MVKMYGIVHNNIIPANGWYHYLKWITNLSVRNCAYDVKQKKLKKSKYFATLGKGLFKVEIKTLGKLDNYICEKLCLSSGTPTTVQDIIINKGQ
jgi:hypothetical protein